MEGMDWGCEGARREGAREVARSTLYLLETSPESSLLSSIFVEASARKLVCTQRSKFIRYITIYRACFWKSPNFPPAKRKTG